MGRVKGMPLCCLSPTLGIARSGVNTSMLQMKVFADVHHSFDEADNPSPNSKFTKADKDAAVASERDVWAFLHACRTPGVLPGVGSVPSRTAVGSTPGPTPVPASGHLSFGKARIGHCVTDAAYISNITQCNHAAKALGLKDTGARSVAYTYNPVGCWLQ